MRSSPVPSTMKGTPSSLAPRSERRGSEVCSLDCKVENLGVKVNVEIGIYIFCMYVSLFVFLKGAGEGMTMKLPGVVFLRQV